MQSFWLDRKYSDIFAERAESAVWMSKSWGGFFKSFAVHTQHHYLISIQSFPEKSILDCVLSWYFNYPIEQKVHVLTKLNHLMSIKGDEIF